MSRDPAEEVGGVNLYAFVLNDPVGLLDPLGEMATPLAPVWSMWMPATTPNPEWVPNGRLDYRVHIGFSYPRNLPRGSTQVWLLNRIDVRYLTTWCQWDEMTLYVIDVGTYPRGQGPVSAVDTDERSAGDHDSKMCLYYSTVAKTHGFNPRGTLAPGGPNQTIDKATYDLRMSQLVGPTHVAEVKYTFEEPYRCLCCTLHLTGNHEHLNVSGLGSWGGGW